MASSGAMIVLDGSYGEGGGGLVRTALSVAALTQQSLRIEKVRFGTPYPGVDSEDILLAKALAEVCDAETPGLELGAETLTFHPTCRPRPYHGALEPTEGSRAPNVLVLLSTLTPVLARAGALSDVTAQGETYGLNSLTYDYFARVGLQALRSMGIYAYPQMREAGFGRDSRGEASVEVEPSVINGIQWEDRGRLESCKCVITTSRLAASIADRGMSHVRRIAAGMGIDLEVEWIDAQGAQVGAHVTCWAVYQRGVGGSTAMGSRGLRMEHLAQNAFDGLTRWMATDSTVDPYLADQLLLPGAFANGVTIFKTPRLTKRFLTSIWVLKQFLPIHLTVKGKEDDPGMVVIKP